MKQPDLGKKIIELRHAKGLTQGELAEKCKLSLRTIQRIELAEVTPRSYTAKIIFSCLEYDIFNSFEEYPNQAEKSSHWIKFWFEQFYKSVLELINLKTNTMKKVSFISITLIFISMGLLMVKNESNAQSIPGWIKAGDKPNSYDMSIDKGAGQDGKNAATIKSIDKKVEGFGTLMQSCNPDKYLGKRIRMTGYVKSENVVAWAGLWFRVDQLDSKQSLSFDNMQDRPIQGTTGWNKYEIVLDVPDNASRINYGALISGAGQIWFDNITIEIVSNTVQTTGTFDSSKQSSIQKEPTNLDFEK